MKFGFTLIYNVNVYKWVPDKRDDYLMPFHVEMLMESTR